MTLKQKAIGVDIGGTKIAAGLVDANGEILFRARTPMVASAGAAAGLGGVKSAIDRVLEQCPEIHPAAIGISCPGPLDPITGIVLNPPNLACWRNFPLRAEIEAAYGLPVRLDNDGNSAALAEALWGAGAGFPCVFCATIGTGIGTGVILDGKILHGRTGAAAEGGHLSIDYRGEQCSCGKRGCIEAVASGHAIARRAIRKLSENGNSGPVLLQLANGDARRITAETVAEAWRQGDALATAVLRETAELLAIWLGNIIDVLEPHVIVVGGGAGALIANFFAEIQQQLPRWSINQRCREIPLRVARYGGDAGIAGAAALCFGADTGESAVLRQQAASPQG